MARKSKKPSDMSILLHSSSSGTLAQIRAKTNSLTLLADIVRQICPDLPQDAWHIANFQQKTLIIEVKSPVWGQRLQFERNKICQELSLQTNKEFNLIEIKVNPLHNRQKAPEVIIVKSSSLISKSTANHLKNIAMNAPKGLKEKLLKLASHGK